MFQVDRKKAGTRLVCVIGVTGVLSVAAMAQGGAPGAAPPAPVAASTSKNFHMGFNRPEAWGLKYFASTTLLSGLPAVESSEGHHTGSVSVGLELGWIPQLDAGQMQIGFNGKTPESLNNAPMMIRPVVRVGLPWKLTAIVSAPPPFRVWGVTPHLLEFGLERPLLEREHWMLSWRGYGQVGSVKGAFTCPGAASEFAPGTPVNPACGGQSRDVATLRYAGSEFELAYKIPSMPKLIPHIAAGGNFIDGALEINSPLTNGNIASSREWTRGGTFSGTAGITYMITKQAAFTVDAFYSPLFVQRSPTAPTTNDGLFNVRAAVNYSFR